MFDLLATKQFSLAGKQFSHQETISKGSIEAVEELVPVALAAVLTVRTDANTGSLTMDSITHGIVTGNKVDLYWTNLDGTIGSRRGVTVGTVAAPPAVVVPIDLGAGDDLPIATTVIQVAVVQVYVVSIAGDDVAALLAAADFARCTIVLMSTGDTVEELAIVLPLNGAYDWLSTGGGANPITGDDIDAVHMTHNDTVTPRNVRLAALLDV